MDKDLINNLESILNLAASKLPKVTSKKMFGCHALFVNENVFALVWKHGRIGVKLPSETDYDVLMKKSGSIPWKAGSMKMAHWVLVPESFHAKPNEIKKWAIKAHELCAKLENKKSVKTKKKVK